MGDRITSTLVKHLMPLSTILLLIILCITFSGRAWAQGTTKLVADSLVEPKVGVFITAEDIAFARNQVKTQNWAAKEASAIMAAADEWMQKPDSWFLEMVPPKGATFAYGDTGCPVDGSDWQAFGRNGVADFARPFVLQCTNGELIDVNDPASPYYDSGKGITINGIKYYLKGIWNAYVVDQLLGQGSDNGAVHDLAYAYALTGDKQYAQKAAFIMDALATVQPTTIGPRDFTTSEVANQGRFHWLTSIVYRARMHLINAYDLIYHAIGPDTPSATNPGHTMRENIEDGLFLDYVFGQHDMRNGRLAALNNHEADSVRGMLGVGLLLGIPEYITWGLDSISKFLDNTIDRDGLYFETSLTYSQFTQGVFLSMAELAYNYSPDNYEGTGFPERSDFPYNANFYDHPKLQRFLIGYRDRVDAIGFLPAIGDASPNLTKMTDFSWRLDSRERIALEHFATRVSDPAQRQHFADYLIDSSYGDLNRLRSGRWSLFHERDLTHASPVVSITGKQRNSESQLLGNTTMGYLRSGTPPFARAALMRGGSTLAHGQDDVLSLSLYARGFDINTEIGYGIAGTPLNRGWASTGIAHNLVVVNRGLDRSDERLQVGPGGDTLAFISNPGLSGMEMDSYQMFQPSDNMQQYQRGVWQIDITANESYWLDFFRITGGTIHDYSFHVGSGTISFVGVQMAAVPNVWTLHGLDDPHASIDEPGKSWSERITTGENIRDLGVPSEGVRARGWTPYPGNGYGFIYDLQGGVIDSAWSATWILPDISLPRVRLTMLPQGGAQQVYRGFGPDLSGKNKYAYVIGRREDTAPLQSRYVSVLQVYAGTPLVSEVTELPKQKGHSQAVALKVQLRGSTGVDYILSSPQPGMVLQAQVDDTLLQTDALFAMVRVTNGEIVQWHIAGGSYMRVGAQQLTMSTGELVGTIEAVDYAQRQLVTRTPLPLSNPEGATITFSNPNYSRNTAYTLVGVSDLGNGSYGIELGDSVMELGRSAIASISESNINLKVPLPYGFLNGSDTRALHGKLVVNMRTGSASTIKQVWSAKGLQLTLPSADWQVDDELVIYDVKVGDAFNVVTSAFLVLDGTEWKAAGTVPVQLQQLQ